MASVCLVQIILVLACGWCIRSEFLNNKPYPTYSLEDMPDTSFTCRDKILGGYYADSETDCQMFHVCVKEAGIGVKDFRFLCPNGTAFDQDVQICADWGDVDCEATTLYYSSDNFDLYRISSDGENKRAPYAFEVEAPDHLQRAETGDQRLNQQTYRVDQRESNSYYAKSKKTDSIKSNAQATARQYVNDKNNINYNNQDVSNSQDDILRGSHSSNFFSKNNGREIEDEVVIQKKPTVELNRNQIRGGVHGRGQNSNNIQKTTLDNRVANKVTSFPKNKEEATTLNSINESKSSTNYLIQSTNQFRNNYQTGRQQARNENNYVQTTTKKFSTLVPRDQYNPTTFKPTTYNGNSDILRRKSISTFNPLYQPNNKNEFYSINGSVPTSTTTTSTKPVSAHYINRFTDSSYFPTTEKTRTPQIRPQTLKENNNKKDQTTLSQTQYSAGPTTNAQYSPFQKYDVGFTNNPPISTKDRDYTNDQYKDIRKQYYSSEQTKNQYITQSQPQSQTDKSVIKGDIQRNSGNRLVLSNEQGQIDDLRLKNKQKDQSIKQYIPTSIPAQYFDKRYETSTDRLTPQIEEDEFLKTAHSQNFVASRNNNAIIKIAENNIASTIPYYHQSTYKESYDSKSRVSTSIPRGFSVSNNKNIAPLTVISTPSPTPVDNKKKVSAQNSHKLTSKPKEQKNASYDYAYYDNTEHYLDHDYENIDEFVKTAGHPYSQDKESS